MIDLNSCLGVLLGFLIGCFCRWFKIPLPAPPNILGATMVMIITLGFLTGNYIQT